MMSTTSQLQNKWMPDREFGRAYDSLKPEFGVARQLVAARNRAGLTQAQVAGGWERRNPQSRVWRAATDCPA